MASIPLPALHAQPPQQDNILDQVARVQQLKSMQGQQALQQQALQAGQLENQQRELGLKSQQAITQAYTEANGDLDKAIPLAAKYGATPQSLLELRSSMLQQKKANIELLNAQGARAIQEADMVKGAHDQVASLPAEQRPAAYQMALQQLQNSGVDVSQAPAEYPGDQQFNMWGMAITSHTKQLEDLAKQAGITKDTAQAEQAQASADKTKAETKAYESLGFAPGVSAELMGMADWLKKNPGKGASDFIAWKARQAPLAQINVANAAGGGLSDTALDQAAEKYWQTGQLPPGARGAAGLVQNRKIMNRAAELHPQGNLAANSAEYKANAGSLANVQKQFDAVSAFEGTANRNIEVLKSTLKDIPDLGSRFANVPARMISSKLLGTEGMAKYQAALTTVQNEAAKILNSSNASGVLSDNARKELQDVIDGNMPVRSILATLQTLQQDFGNRHAAYQEQINDIKGRLNGGQQSQQSETQGETIRYKIVNGQLVPE